MPTDQDAQFSDRLSAAISRQTLTLDQIVERLGQSGTSISAATLSYWQRGRSLPTREASLAVIDELEKVLRLPVGHLRGTLPSDAFSRARARDIGCGSHPHGPPGHLPGSCPGQGVDHFAVLALTPAPDSRLVRVSASHGCELIDAHLVAGDVLVMDVRPEQELRSGDLLQPRFTVEWASPAQPFTRLRQRMPQPVGHRSLLLHFEGEAPTAVQAEVTTLDGEVNMRELVPARQVMDAMVDAPAGTTVVSWELGGTGEVP